MANKLKINRPSAADLASLSVYPNPYHHQHHDRSAYNGRRNQGKFASSSYNNQRDNTIIQPNSIINRPPQPLHLYNSGGSQSQQSFSQGFNNVFSQPFSQVSQDEPCSSLLEELQWRSNRSAIAGVPPHDSSQCDRDEGNVRPTKMALPAPRATNLIQKLNSSSLPEIINSFPSKEVEKRLETLSEDLSKIITVLDSLHGDLQKISRDANNASMESEGIKEKVMLQESSIQLLLKEEEKFREIIAVSLKQLSEKEEYANSLEKLSNKLEMLPSTFTQHLAMVKSDLFTCIHNELQTVRECIRSTQMEGWSAMNRINPYAFVDGAEVASQKSKLPASSQRKESAKPRKDLSKPVKDSSKQRKDSSMPEKDTQILSKDSSMLVNDTSKPLQDSSKLFKDTSKFVKDSSKLGNADMSKTVKLDSIMKAKLDSSKQPKRRYKRPANSQQMESKNELVVKKRARPSTRLKTGKVLDCPINLDSSNLSPINHDEKGWISKRKCPPPEHKVGKNSASDATRTKVTSSKQKNALSILTFEMEEETVERALPLITGISTQALTSVDENLDDEIQAKIRQQMIKARRKRLQSSSSVSCSG